MGKRAKGEGTIYKVNEAGRNAKWCAEVTVRLPNGRTKRIRAYGMTQEEAAKRRTKKVAQAKRANPEADKLPLDKYLADWLAFKEPDIRKSTLADYEKNIRLHINPAVGDVPLSKVTALDVQNILTDLSTGGKHATADKVRRCLKQAFKQAVMWDLITVSPMDKLKPIKKKIPKRGVWQPDEAKRFLEAAVDRRNPNKPKPIWYYAMFYAALYTGLRKGELMALRWSDITSMHLHVRRSYNTHEDDKVGPPKTEAGERSIPLSGGMKRVLEQQRERLDNQRSLLGDAWQEHDLVFPSEVGTMLTERNINREFANTMHKAGVPVIRFHDMRRIFATYLARKGFQPKVIQKLLGHSTPRMALEVYTDVLKEQEDAAFLEDDDITGGSSGGNKDAA